MRGWVPQAEQARAAALQVVLIGVLIAAMLVLRPRGLFGNFRERVPGRETNSFD
jgi:branched-chain amino acid transport system permease protein